MTANLGHEDEARARALSLIKRRLESGAYEQDTILHTSYLGPDLDKLHLFGGKGSGSLDDSSSNAATSHPTIYYVAIGVVSLAICALIAFLAMAIKLRKERKRRAVASIVSTASIPSHRSSEIPVGDMHVSYSAPSSSHASVYSSAGLMGYHDRKSLLGHDGRR